MDEKLLRKMILSCFRQYQHDADSVPLNEAEYEEFIREIMDKQASDPKADLYEIINDIVYEYLAN
ncbi:YqzH family protein [Mesobacillus harenae]|uniref:YqzH family protein n=1 Tax=Mesobacillus harenae TaxID=2213203 RepID=UPI001580B1D3|nr:YqzH family protein [Mesobacillus harenae]